MKNKKRMSSMIFQNISVFLIIFFIFVSSGIYLFVSNTLEEITIKQNIETSKQINQNFITYFDNLINSSQYITDVINNKSINDNKDIKEIFELSIVIYDYVDEIVLYDTNYKLIANTNYTTIRTDWYDLTLEDQTMYHFHSEYNYYEKAYNGYLSRKIDFYNGSDYQTGIIFIKMNFDMILSITDNTNLGDEGQICMIDTSYNVIYTSNIQFDQINILKELILGNDTTIYNNTHLQVYLNTISNSPWRIAVFTNIDSIYEANNQLLITLIFTVISCILITMIVIHRISYKVTYPLGKLESIMKEIEESRIFLQIDNVDSNLVEISSLTSRFNEMIKEITLLIDKVIIEQKAQRLSELKSLQNQMNPHFLYNTLDSIVYLAETNQNDKVIDMTIALSDLFRVSISRGKFIIPLKDEIQHAKCYLVIQKIRYQEAFDYEFEVDEDVNECETMKLTLQPLIENAIYHGLRNRVDPGFIKIKAYKEDSNVVYEVTDNGYGMREEKIQELYSTFNNANLNDGVGMKNVYQRLKIYFNNKADLKIISELDEGTTIRITIPINREEE